MTSQINLQSSYTKVVKTYQIVLDMFFSILSPFTVSQAMASTALQDKTSGALYFGQKVSIS